MPSMLTPIIIKSYGENSKKVNWETKSYHATICITVVLPSVHFRHYIASPTLVPIIHVARSTGEDP